MSFLTGFAGLLRENQFDVLWVGHIAEAFEKAGGTESNLVLDLAILNQNDRIGTNRYHPLLDGLFGNPFAPGGELKTTPTAKDVGLWWKGLTDAQRAELIASVPLVIGNLNGIPISTRIEANALTARYFAGKGGLTKMERTYWESVANGTRTLVSSDPANDRIIEMIGTLTPVTKETITHIPGTGASLKHFYSREIQAFSEGLVKDNLGETVSFVYKDGPWVTWAGERSNHNNPAMQAMGDRVAAFQHEVIGRDPIGRRVPPNATTHSAGLTVTSGAERAGARFATVHSLSGSYLMPEWTPIEGTKYHHHQFHKEVINNLDGVTLWSNGTPHSRPYVFEQHIYDGGEQGGLDAHNRIAQGPATNAEVVERIGKLIRESR
ncbi:hypothetical protein [Leucobacter komagatae]|uniref:hypothetical protein n=1 Tax=Leucobacter komagatae TaxID=55969 RepID=UPI00114D8AF4|nr:hypothetical protein [Leucobacter komagatae]